MKRILTAAAAITCAACGPSQYELALQECTKLDAGRDAKLACIYRADAERERRAATALAIMGAANSAAAIAAPAPAQQPAYVQPRQQTTKVKCTPPGGTATINQNSTVCKTTQQGW